MTTTIIRKKVHQYIDEAEENVLEVVYKMLKLYAGDDNQSMLSDEQKKELDRRSKLYHQGKLKASSWEEVKQRTRAGR